MGQYTLSEQQENDFRFSTGKSFKEWLDENLPAWADSAKINRKTALSRAVKDMNDELVQQFVETAKISNL